MHSKLIRNILQVDLEIIKSGASTLKVLARGQHGLSGCANAVLKEAGQSNGTAVFKFSLEEPEIAETVETVYTATVEIKDFEARKISSVRILAALNQIEESVQLGPVRTAITLPKLRPVKLTYFLRGNLEEENILKYKAGTNLVESITGQVNEGKFLYNAKNQIEKIETSHSTAVIKYDAKGRMALVEITDSPFAMKRKLGGRLAKGSVAPEIIYKLSYNTKNQVITIDTEEYGDRYAQSLSYDNRGNCTQIKVPGDRITMTYDNNPQPFAITNIPFFFGMLGPMFGINNVLRLNAEIDEVHTYKYNAEGLPTEQTLELIPDDETMEPFPAYDTLVIEYEKI